MEQNLVLYDAQLTLHNGRTIDTQDINIVKVFELIHRLFPCETPPQITPVEKKTYTSDIQAIILRILYFIQEFYAMFAQTYSIEDKITEMFTHAGINIEDKITEVCTHAVINGADTQILHIQKYYTPETKGDFQTALWQQYTQLHNATIHDSTVESASRVQLALIILSCILECSLRSCLDTETQVDS